MKTIKWYLIMILLCSFIAGLVYSLYHHETVTDHADFTSFSLSDFTVADLAEPERTYDLQQITADAPVLMNVWGSWCASCHVEHPYLLSLAQQGVKIIGVNYLDDRHRAQKWLADLGDPYQINLFDANGTLGANLGVIGAPETYLLNSQGQIMARHRGIMNAEIFTRQFKPLLSLSSGS